MASTEVGSDKAKDELDIVDLTFPRRPGEELALVEIDGGEVLKTNLIEPLAVLNGETIETDGGVLVEHKETKPIRVEPLAVVLPRGLEVPSSEKDGNYGRKPSDWVQSMVLKTRPKRESERRVVPVSLVEPVVEPVTS
jgi:hypothetical protein